MTSRLVPNFLFIVGISELLVTSRHLTEKTASFLTLVVWLHDCKKRFQPASMILRGQIVLASMWHAAGGEEAEHMEFPHHVLGPTIN